MPNKCTKCGKLHDDDANYLLTTGCDSCGGRFFFFVREGYVPEVEEEVSRITKKEMKEIERDIRSILPIRVWERKSIEIKDGKIKERKNKQEKGEQEEETVVLDIEAIRVIKPGKYRINVETLFNQKPIVVKVGAGKYEIDFSVIAEKFGATKK
ncbi:MAG: Zn-ribbon containing protein [Nanoarchaeota archaeon]|nr:Zn-ribbon domain-containing protein [Nanoarchaeota archaeon]MBU4299825.1 Zn-ribbon domain-containing protein [Nanoarchaeota archaeon]MBU4451294.1 Zn-ribbon domain-containing protein [Nanoarchaeota archaeon]MCG2723583.1 Zn-ribbon domain-containing protein [archaeon]